MTDSAHTPDGGGLTEAEREALVARALFDHDWLGTADRNREAVWVMHRDAYRAKARAVLPVIARIVAAEHDGCADLLDAASDALLAARTAPDTETVAAAVWDEALAAVVRGVNSAKDAHAEHGHRQIVSALVGLAQAVPRTENPYRRAAGVREGREGTGGEG